VFLGNVHVLSGDYAPHGGSSTASTGAREGPVSLFTVVRRQSNTQELLGATSREVAQLTIAARWCICGINKASFAQGREGP
jgi:hypothetical protein